MDTLKIRVIMEYEYRFGRNAAQVARNINDVYGANTTNQRTTWYWFARFRSGNFDMKNEPRGCPKTLVDNDELKAIVEADDTQSILVALAILNTLKYYRKIRNRKKNRLPFTCYLNW